MSNHGRPLRVAIIGCGQMGRLRFAGAVASLAIGDFGPSPRLGKACYQLFDAAGRSATVYRYYDGVIVGRGRDWLDYGPDGVARVRTSGLPTGGSREEVQSTEAATAHLTAPERADPIARMGYAGALAEFVACARGCDLILIVAEPEFMRPSYQINVYGRDGWRSVQPNLADLYLYLLEQFVAMVRTGRTEVVPLDEIVEVVAVLEAGKRSLAEGREVAVAEVLA